MPEMLNDSELELREKVRSFASDILLPLAGTGITESPRQCAITDVLGV